MTKLSLSLTELQSQAGPSLEILTRKEDNRFRELSKRWTDIGREIPAAIILPESEEQIRQTVTSTLSHRTRDDVGLTFQVQWAVRSSIPFVPRSGGHSEWSTIGDDGVAIDLSKYSGIKVNVDAREATLRGSILSKQVAVALADAKLFTGKTGISVS